MYKHRKVFKVPGPPPLTVLCNKTVHQPSNDSPNSHKHLLQSDDSLFLKVQFDNANSSIGDSSFSSFESPEINLNSAIIVPNSLKRKSSNCKTTKFKKRLLDEACLGETSVTDTEFLNIETRETDAQTKNFCTNEFLSDFDSQVYFSTQFKREAKFADRSVTSESQLERNVTKLNLTQIFNDDFENDIDGMELPCNQSQMFLEAAKTMGQLPGHPSQKLEELEGTKYRSKNASLYIELQRSMHVENEGNVIDDDFVDPELSQAIKSTQYRREIEEDFIKCEETLCNLENLNESGRSIDMNVAMNMSTDHLQGLNEINWNSPVIPSRTALPVDTPPSSLIKKRLALFSKSRESLSDATATIKSRNFKPMGPFFGLPIDVKSLIKEYKGIDDLYDWQKECLTLPAVSLRNNLIYALPTSGGKTLVAEILILREIICRRSNCLFILPYVSIVQEKIWALSPFAVRLEFLLEEYAAGKGQLPPRKRRQKNSVYIATIEKGLAVLDSLIEVGRANEIGLIVVDELHIIGEPGRGATLETLLTKAMFIGAGIQIVGMSATIGNLNEIATFLNADVYTRNFRPVELKEYIKCGSEILAIDPNAQSPEEAFTVVRKVDFGYKEEVSRLDPDHLGGLVNEIIPDDSCLVFCSSKQNCESVALLLCRVLPRKSVLHRQSERHALRAALESDTGALCPVLSKTIPHGIAYHHSGLTTEERRHLENAFRQNIICVICCTSTLAAGVNLPAKRVIIRSPYIGRDFLTLSRYKQMVGRAGRAGMGDCGESITIFEPKDHRRMIDLLTAPMDEAASGLHLSNSKGLNNLILSSIGLGIASCLNDLKNLISKTLLAVQAERLGLNIDEIINDTVKDLFKLKALTSSLSTTQLSCSNIEFENSGASIEEESTPTDKTKKKQINVVLKPSSQLNISEMGKASFKSCIDLRKSQIIYNDLKEAQKSLVLSDHLHLLYIVTPYEPVDINMTIDMKVYYTQYSRLSPVQMQTAKTLGITESCAMKMVTGQSFKSHMTRTVHRFFLTLILNELWQQKPIHQVAETFHVNRGVIQNLAVAAASYASSVIRFCEELEEFWACKVLLLAMGRARQLYSNGYKTLEDVAKTSVTDLVEKIDHLNYRVARQLISAAKVLLLERLETLRGEVQDCLDVLCSPKTN